MILNLLENFFDNMPNFNVALCQLILQLFDFETKEEIPLEALQFWLYALQVKERKKSKVSKEQQIKIDQFNLAISQMRQKYLSPGEEQGAGVNNQKLNESVIPEDSKDPLLTTILTQLKD